MFVRKRQSWETGHQWHQLFKEQPATVRKQDTILVEERLDGAIHFSIRDKYLNAKIITERPQKSKKTDWIIPAKNRDYTPAANHPWKSRFILKV